MNRGIMYLCAGLGILCAFLAGLQVINWNKNHDQDVTIKVQAAHLQAVVTARKAERIATVAARYNQCLGAIKTIHLANEVITSQKSILSDLAATSRQRAALETSAAARELDLQVSRARAAASRKLTFFHPVTRKECRDRRDRELHPPPPKKEEGGQ